jgi:hypothetical protein
VAIEGILKVSEYFLFDPKGDYLKPPLQGYRLTRGLYVPIKILGLHLERSGQHLRLYDPAKGEWLPTRRERALEAEAKFNRERSSRLQAEAEVARLRRELERLSVRWSACQGVRLSFSSLHATSTISS